MYDPSWSEVIIGLSIKAVILYGMIKFIIYLAMAKAGKGY